MVKSTLSKNRLVAIGGVDYSGKTTLSAAMTKNDFFQMKSPSQDKEGSAVVKKVFREFVTYGWFDKTKRLLNPAWAKEKKETKPWLLVAINNLQHNKKISSQDREKIVQSIDFITLLRNEMLHVNRGTPDQGITHLDIPTKERLWNSASTYFKSLGARNSAHIQQLYNKHSTVVKKTKNLMWTDLIHRETEERGIAWKNNLDLILDTSANNFSLSKALNFEDSLLQIATVWGSHYRNNPQQFSLLAREYVNINNWEVLASLACSPLCPSDVLHKIGSDLAKEEGLGYILRIVGRNPNTDRETLVNISTNTNLDDRYRKIARLHLEKGLHIATTRAS